MRSKIAAAAMAAVLLSTSTAALAQEPAWQVCFTPGQDCTGLLVGEIGCPISRRRAFAKRPPLMPMRRWMRQMESGIPADCNASCQDC